MSDFKMEDFFSKPQIMQIKEEEFPTSFQNKFVNNLESNIDYSFSKLSF